METSSAGSQSGDNPAISHGQPRLQEIQSLLFESAPDAMIVTDHDGRIVELNAESESTFGYRREELIGERVEKLIPDRFREAHRLDRAAYQAAPTYRPMSRVPELFALRKDGSELPVDISLSPVQTKSGTLFFGIIRDITERRVMMELARHLKFEQALVGLSSKFINLPPDRVDLEIVDGLRLLTEALGADRVSIAKADATTNDFLITHAWGRPGVPNLILSHVKSTLPWAVELIMNGGTLIIGAPEDLPPEAYRERQYLESTGVKSALNVPFRVAGQVIGGMAVDSFHQHLQWDDAIVSRVRDVADVFANALSRKHEQEKLQNAYSQIEKLKNQLEQENRYLREEIKLDGRHNSVVGNSAAIRGVLKKAEQVASTDSTVLILGETGTGKELIARTIHEMSGRSQRPMIKTNCAALPATLIESELFGREKGAYTGALAREIGRFELADKSTIFLDEVGELPLDVQPKLLRVLQEGQFERLGSSRTIQVDVRVIAATSRDLQAMMREGKFREDLFYRLNVFPIRIAPLRERREDIPALIWHVLGSLGNRMGRNIQGVRASTMRDLQRYSWPGNVRELCNLVERNLILNTGPIFRVELADLESSHASLQRLDDVESEHLRNVLQSTHWRIRGPGGAAQVLGVKPTTLEARLKKLGIRRPAA